MIRKCMQQTTRWFRREHGKRGWPGWGGRGVGGTKVSEGSIEFFLFDPTKFRTAHFQVWNRDFNSDFEVFSNNRPAAVSAVVVKAFAARDGAGGGSETLPGSPRSFQNGQTEFVLKTIKSIWCFMDATGYHLPLWRVHTRRMIQDESKVGEGVQDHGKCSKEGFRCNKT